MAALFVCSEADQKENGVQTELELAQQKMDKEDKVISSGMSLGGC